jgi:hypothetical protein
METMIFIVDSSRSGVLAQTARATLSATDIEPSSAEPWKDMPIHGLAQLDALAGRHGRQIPTASSRSDRRPAA